MSKIIPGIFLTAFIALQFLQGCVITKSKASNSELTVEANTGESEKQIRCVKVSKTRLTPVVHCTGQISSDFGKECLVGVRLSGRLLKLLVAPGDAIKKGQTIGFVDSQQIGDLQAAAIQASVRLKMAKAQEEREHSVLEEELVRPKALIRARTAREKAQVVVKAARRDFERVESLYKEKIAAAKDYFDARSFLEKVSIELEQLKAEETREKHLFDNKCLIRKDWQLAHADTERCQNELATIKERLLFLGVPDATVNSIVNAQHLEPMIPIVSPISGTVIQQFASAGEIVQADKPVVSICDLGQVAVACSLPEADVGIVKVKAPVEARISGLHNESFKGFISYIGSRIDPQTRTASLRAVIPNKQNKLKLNMFADIIIEGEALESVACPKEALHHSSGRSVVYIKNGEQFKEVEVKIGVCAGDLVEILSGLSEGDEVVTEGGVLVKTELSLAHGSNQK